MNDSLLRATGTAALRKPMLPDQLQAAERDMAYRAGQAFWDVSSGKAAQGKTEFEALAQAYPSVPNVHYLYGSYLLTKLGRPKDAARERQEFLRLKALHQDSAER